MEWTVCVESFVKVAVNKSFAKTAESMNTTGPTITKRVQWLESHLKVALLTRTTRHVELTAAGREFFAKSEPLLQEWEQLKQSTFQQQRAVSGLLSLACSPQFGRVLFMPLIAQFRKKYPEIQIQLTASPDGVNLIDQGIDLYLGVGRFIKDVSTSIAIPIKNDYCQCFASKKYIDQFGKPDTLSDLKHHQAVALIQDKSWKINGQFIKPNVVFSSNDTRTVMHAAALGVGVGFFPVGIVRDLYTEHELVGLLPDCVSDPLKIVICHPNLPYKPQRSVLFLNFLKNYFKDSMPE